MKNRATELGEMDGQVEDVNRSGLPEAGPVVEVNVRSTGGGLELMPKNAPARRPVELRESEDTLLASQLTEDPEMTQFMVPNVGKIEVSPRRLPTAATRNQNREMLVWFGIDKANLSAAMGDRIIVRRDLMESEYICAECRGRGYGEEVCGLCEGRQQKDGVPCRQCVVMGFDRETRHPSGFRICSHCAGSGWRNGIVIPESAQGVPVTGTVVSIGPGCQWLKLGDRVLHSKFAGHTLDRRGETYTYMREHEVISLLKEAK